LKEGRARRFFQGFLRDLGVFAVQIFTVFELKGDFANTLAREYRLLMTQVAGCILAP
jgi:hypothetical protein